MNPQLSAGDAAKVKSLIATRQRNNDVAWMLCDYINDTPAFITPELMHEVVADGSHEKLVYAALLAGACGLDPESRPSDDFLLDTYFMKSVNKLDANEYAANDYYRNIAIPSQVNGRWSLISERYRPYEAFICNDIVLEPDFTEIQRVGFFDSEFSFPAVMQDGREWMAIKPNEVETMKPALNAVAGDVVAFGLGLGYFAYMASQKSDVEHVVVVDNDGQVIDLFKKYILPQFANANKVQVVQCDAFEYIRSQMPAMHFGYAFVDLWHDASDGLPIYLKVKKMEQLSPNTVFLYWIENTLLSSFRWSLFDSIVDCGKSYDEIISNLGNDFLRKLAATQISSNIHNKSYV